MVRTSGFLLLCIVGLAQGASPQQASKESVVSAEALIQLGYRTKDLGVDIVSFAATSAYKMVSPHTEPLEKQFWLQYAEVQKLYKLHGKVHVDPVLGAASNAYATASTTATPFLFQIRDILSNLKDKVAMQVNALADVIVENFEKAHPARKGVVPKDFNSRALLLVWLIIMAYVALRLLKLAKSIFCYFFCCGFCAKRKAAPKVASKAATAKAKAQQQPVAPKKKGK